MAEVKTPNQRAPRQGLGASPGTDSGLWAISLTELGLGAITTLKELREIRLDGMPVMARWLEKLKALDKLERLSLQGCKRLGDDAAPLLASWTSVRVLDLKETAISEKGLAELRRAKPNAQIFHGSWEELNDQPFQGYE